MSTVFKNLAQLAYVRSNTLAWFRFSVVESTSFEYNLSIRFAILVEFFQNIGHAVSKILTASSSTNESKVETGN